MGTQEEIFLESEGDAWFARNWLKMGQGVDPVQEIIKEYDLLPPCQEGAILPSIGEIGCSNGWRLAALSDKGVCYGVDPSLGALANGYAKYPDLRLVRGTATATPWSTGYMNLVIYGFCLYVCDPIDHFEIATQGDRVLANEGFIVIHDFDAEYPHSVTNIHFPGLRTYKMDWGNLWLNNPAYSLVVKKKLPDDTAIWVLRKDTVHAFPVEEPKC